MANYVSSHTGAEIDAAVDKANALPAVTEAHEGDIMSFSDGEWSPANLTLLMVEKGLYTPNLATDSWAVINDISASGNAANYYAVGDTKEITLNGTMGTFEIVDMTAYVYIIGFNHNAAVEGNGITFGTFKFPAEEEATPAEPGGEGASENLGKSAADDIDICLVDGAYGGFGEPGDKTFSMNHWGEIGGKGEILSYNHGGWAGCDMRYDILGSTNVAPDDYGEATADGREGHDPTSTCATNPVANTLMSCLPAALRAVMKPITKYTDNVGGGNGDVEANVTASIDYLPLLAEHEVHGAAEQEEWRGANSYETEHQAQYAYYANGNSKIKYKSDDGETAAWWWLRSPNRDDSGNFCVVNEDGDAGNGDASFSGGVAPLFKV